MRRRLAVIGAVLAVALVCLTGVALGASSTTTEAPRTTSGPLTGEVRFMGAMGCHLNFAFRGFRPGAKAQVQVSWRGTSRTFQFSLPGDAKRMIDISSILGLGGHRQVAYRVMAQGAVSISGMARVHCNCEEEGGGGGGGGGGGSGGGSSGGSAGTAGPAAPIDAQPSFTG